MEFDRQGWDRLDLSDVPDLPPADDGSVPPPPDPPDEREPGRSPASRPPGDDAAISGTVTVLWCGLLLALGAVQFAMMSFGARGGMFTVLALSATFCLFFLVPFYLGSVWLGRQMEASRLPPRDRGGPA